MQKSAGYEREIRKRFPQLAWNNSDLVQDGVDHVVVILDGRWFFRFPDTVPDENLAREIRVLRYVRPRISLPAPRYDYIAPDYAFVGGPVVTGIKFLPGIAELLDAAALRTTADQLADFLTTVHAMPAAELTQMGVEDNDATFKDLRNRLPSYLHQSTHFLSRQDIWQLNVVIKQLQSLPSGSRHTFTHGDVWHKHIYYDPAQRKLSGIIDWGDVCFDDPAHDCFGLWAYGESYVDMVLENYGHRDPSLKSRSLVYFLSRALGCLVSHQTTGDNKLLEYGQALLQRYLGR